MVRDTFDIRRGSRNPPRPPFDCKVLIIGPVACQIIDVPILV
jgi:hypothetical protein